METLWVYGDFDWLNQPIRIGELVHESLNGRHKYAFEFEKPWLSKYGFISLSGDLRNRPRIQYTHPEKKLFGCFADTLPDRWGRTLIERMEQVNAQYENRPVRQLNAFDYLTSIDDTIGKGAFRYKRSPEYACVNEAKGSPTPTVASVRTLAKMVMAFERCEKNGQLPSRDYLCQLLRIGNPLGGARPKAVLSDERGTPYIAKFPSTQDTYDVAVWEHITHRLAKQAGIDTADTSIVATDGPYHVLLSKRFDRTNDGKRIHFSSAQAQLGLSEDQNADTGNGFLDIVEFIFRGCHDVRKHQEELYRRVAFYIAVGNTDDHFRNHGFLLTSKGWVLSPAYDLNPTHQTYQSLLINETSSESSLKLLLESASDYLLDSTTAKRIIQEVKAGIANWRTVASQCGASQQEIDNFTPVLDKSKP